MQLSWPEQLAGDFLSLCLSMVVRLARRGLGERSRSRRWREGVGGTWMTKVAVESNICDTISGGKVKAGFTTQGPDRLKLGHRGNQKL